MDALKRRLTDIVVQFSSLGGSGDQLRAQPLGW